MKVTRNELRSKIEKLEARRSALKDKEAEAKKVYYDLRNSRDSEIKDIITSYFEEVFEGDEIISYSDKYYRVARKEEDTYQRDIITLIFKAEDWKSKDFETIESSFYSGSGDSRFDLRRMVLLGDVAKLLLNDIFIDNLIDEVNSCIDSYEDKIQKASKVEFSFYKKINEYRKEIKELKEELINITIEEDGIEIVDKPKDVNTRSHYPTLEVKFDHAINSVKRIEILSKTASGKSATINVTYDNSYYRNPETIEWKTSTFKNVRMDNILGFYYVNKDKLVEQDTVAS